MVLTSSFAAVGYGRKEQAAPFDETNWTDPNADGVSAYAKSKTLAERAAWDYVAKEGGLEPSVVNPVGVFGPILGPDTSTSIAVVQRPMDGAVPGLPHIRFGVVDVRDVADLHLRAMTDPRAKGRAFPTERAWLSPRRWTSVPPTRRRPRANACFCSGGRSLIMPLSAACGPERQTPSMRRGRTELTRAA